MPGAWPVPLPLPTSLVGANLILTSFRCSSKSADPASIALSRRTRLNGRRGGPKQAASEGATYEDFSTAHASKEILPRAGEGDVAYLQYSSGSTPASHMVVADQRTEQLLDNLAAHSHGMHLAEADRCVSWLPWYHDMGLVGCFLSPVRQPGSRRITSKPRISLAVRWRGLDLISRNEGTTTPIRPTFGYDIWRTPHWISIRCCRPLRSVPLATSRQRRRHESGRT